MTTTNLDEFDSLLCLVCAGSSPSHEDGRGAQILYGNWVQSHIHV